MDERFRKTIQEIHRIKMRLEHQIKNVVNKVDEAKSSVTPGQKDGVQEHPISKSTSDYEEKFFHAGTEGKDDRDKFITGKKPEHPENVEDTEGHKNPTKKTQKPAVTQEEEEKEEMNIDLKQVENLTEKKKDVELDKESFMGAIAHAASKGKKEVKIGDKVHKVTMDKDTAKKIKKEGVSWEDAVKLAMDTQVQTTKEYWEEQLKKREEGWGGKGGVPGKGTVTTVRKKPNGGMTVGGKK